KWLQRLLPQASGSPSLRLGLRLRLKLYPSVGRHPRFCVAVSSTQPELQAQDLLHAIFLEIRVFRREHRLGIYADHFSRNGLFWIRIQVDLRLLTDLNFPNYAFRNETTQIEFAQIDHSEDRLPRLNHSARLGRARQNRARDWRMDRQVR